MAIIKSNLEIYGGGHCGVMIVDVKYRVRKYIRLGDYETYFWRY